MAILETDIEFQGKDSKQYKFNQLEINDLIRYTRWVQFKPYRDALDAQLPEDLKKEIYQECKAALVEEYVLKEEFKDLAKEDIKEEHLELKVFPISPDSTAVQSSYTTIEGIRRLMEISLEKGGLNPKDILDDNVVKENIDRFAKFIGIISEKKEKPNPTNPNQE